MQIVVGKIQNLKLNSKLFFFDYWSLMNNRMEKNFPLNDSAKTKFMQLHNDIYLGIQNLKQLKAIEFQTNNKLHSFHRLRKENTCSS